LFFVLPFASFFGLSLVLFLILTAPYTLLSTVQSSSTLIRFASLEADEKSNLCLNLLARFSFMLCFFCSILLFQGRHNITKLYCEPEA